MAGVVLLAGALAGRVDDAGRVDYAALRADRASLDEAIATVASVAPEFEPALFPFRQHQLAYALDAYAALVLVSVLDREGRSVVRHLRADPFPFRRHRIGGRRMDLLRFRDVIAHTFRDPRVHVALACGAVSCPAPRAFEPETVEAALDAAVRAFVDDPAHVRMEDGQVLLSPIFRWYRKDFAAAGGALAWIALYRTEPLPPELEVGWLAWDRTLNAQPGRGP